MAPFAHHPYDPLPDLELKEEYLTKNKLPKKPSKLIRLALEDIEKAEKSPEFDIAMSSWASKQSKQPCRVCFAGSVLMQRRLKKNTLKDITSGKLGDFLVDISDVPMGERGQLQFLDSIREYDFEFAFYYLNKFNDRAYSKIEKFIARKYYAHVSDDSIDEVFTDSEDLGDEFDTYMDERMSKKYSDTFCEYEENRDKFKRRMKFIADIFEEMGL